jgi:hypothetical protein
MSTITITDEQKREWAYASLEMRAEFSGQVFELKDNGKVYVLNRTSPKPDAKCRVGFLELVEVKERPVETPRNMIDVVIFDNLLKKIEQFRE